MPSRWWSIAARHTAGHAMEIDVDLFYNNLNKIGHKCTGREGTEGGIKPKLHISKNTKIDQTFFYN